MKKIFSLMGIALLLASCTDDYKDWAEPQSNPAEPAKTITAPTTVSASAFDLETAEGDSIKLLNTAVTVADDYELSYDVSLFNEDKTSSIPLAVDKEGRVAVADLQHAITDLYGKKAEARKALIHGNALVNVAGQVKKCAIDDLEVTITPKPASVPTLWYLIGSCIGDGSWNNSPEAVGVALIPMYPADDPGSDEFKLLEYAGFFEGGGEFKIIETPGSWDVQFGSTDGSIDNPTLDGGGNFVIEDEGYYMFTLNTETKTLEIQYMDEQQHGTPGTICMPGAYNGWNAGGNEMTPMNDIMIRYENHDWYYTELVIDAASEIKFTADGSWGTNWGGPGFPFGVGTQNGSNIPVEAGTYDVYFNDILGRYYFKLR